MYELLWHSIVGLMHYKYMVPLVAGTLAGVVGGALPGVTITMTVIIVLPFTFGLDPLQGLAAMTGVYVGGSAGAPSPPGPVGDPGHPPEGAPAFHGHPRAGQGRAGGAGGGGGVGAFSGRPEGGGWPGRPDRAPPRERPRGEVIRDLGEVAPQLAYSLVRPAPVTS